MKKFLSMVAIVVSFLFVSSLIVNASDPPSRPNSQSEGYDSLFFYSFFQEENKSQKEGGNNYEEGSGSREGNIDSRRFPVYEEDLFISLEENELLIEEPFVLREEECDRQEELDRQIEKTTRQIEELKHKTLERLSQNRESNRNSLKESSE